MTYQLLNTLYVTLESAYLRLDNEAVVIVHADAEIKRVPLHHLSGIVMLGNITVSPPLMHRCAEDGRTLVWLDEFGRFRARVEGRVSGNVLLRRAQHAALDTPDTVQHLARTFVEGKLQNQIQILQRAGRERADAPLSDAVAQLKGYLQQLRAAPDLDAIRASRATPRASTSRRWTRLSSPNARRSACTPAPAVPHATASTPCYPSSTAC